jgi:arabinose-5-phosphate isomerase
MAQTCDLALSHGAQEEAGPIKYAGSSTALNCMALCDALVMATAVASGMTEEKYLHFHPGGAVGKRLAEKFRKSGE